MSYLILVYFFPFIVQLFNLFRKKITAKYPKADIWYFYGDVIAFIAIFAFAIIAFDDIQKQERIKSLTGKFGGQSDAPGDEWPKFYLGTTEAGTSSEMVTFQGEQN